MRSSGSAFDMDTLRAKENLGAVKILINMGLCYASRGPGMWQYFYKVLAQYSL